MSKNDLKLSDLKRAIIEGNKEKARIYTRTAIKKGFTAKDIMEKGLIPGIRKIGDLFGKGEVFLPELIVAGRSMDAAIKYLDPLFKNDNRSKVGKFLIGSVKGDLHDIGKNIVAMMLRGNGWIVDDMGVDVSPEKFCSAIKEGEYSVLGLSALLTTTMENICSTIAALDKMGLRSKVKIIVGGAPVTKKFAEDSGADDYGEDAWSAVIKAEHFL